MTPLPKRELSFLAWMLGIQCAALFAAQWRGVQDIVHRRKNRPRVRGADSTGGC